LSLFITFEGGEGCGKSTQAKALYQKLQQENLPAVLIHEPGGTTLGEEIRKTLKRKTEIIHPKTELLLFAASRSQLVAEIIQPALKEEKIVICDRFSHSTIAYQGYGRKLDLATVKMVNNLATHGIKPDIVIFLDLLPEEGLARRGKLLDRFELQELSFHHQVRQGYLKMAADEPDRWLVVDATLPKKKISEIIWGKVNHSLVGKGYL
jgi:dTMP kinase